MPEVFAKIGPAALPALGAYLADADNLLWARACAAHCIQRIVEAHPRTRAEGLTLLARALEKFATQDPTLNALIISFLLDLQATEAADLIQRAYAARRVDEWIVGDWEEAQVELGLKEARPERGGWWNLFGLKK